MDEHTATEIAYKNGYEAGYNVAKSEILYRIKNFINKLKSIDGNEFINSWYESADICFEFDNESYENFIDNLVKEMNLFEEVIKE